MTRNHQNIRSRCLVHELSFTYIFHDINHGYRPAILKKNSLWLLPFYITVATYFYYKKVCRTMHTAIESYLLKFWSSNIFITIMISNFLFNFINFWFIVSFFLTKFLTLGYFIFNSSKSTSSSEVSDIRYFTFNIIYFSIKSSFSS